MSLASNDPPAGKSPPEPATAASRCIVILGMHRSGTSALTRVVNLFGAELSDSLIPPKPSNVTGFWEAQSIFKIHNELLKEFGLMWHDYLPLPSSWEKTEAAREAKERLLETLRSEFTGRPLFAVKDPRACRLLPMWLEALEEFGAEPLFLFCYRSPLEVAASLYSRDQIPWETSLLLWLRSYVEAEEATRGFRRLFIGYDDLIRDWREVMKQITGHFDLEWPCPIGEAAPEVDAFLSDRHRHHTAMNFDQIDDPETRELLRAMYGALQTDADGSGAGLRELTERATEHLNRKSGIFAPVLKHERKVQFKLQTEKARAQRFNRRLQLKLKRQKLQARKRKRRMKGVLAVAVVTALALGMAGGYWLAKRDAPSTGSSPAAAVEEG